MINKKLIISHRYSFEYFFFSALVGGIIGFIIDTSIFAINFNSLFLSLYAVCIIIVSTIIGGIFGILIED